MRDHNRIAVGVRAFSSLLDAHEAGHTPESIKRTVQDTLLAEFENPQMLERYGIDLLTVEAVNLQKVRSEKPASELYDLCIGIRRRCLRKDREACAKICADWEQEIGDALSLYASAATLEHSKADLSLEEFAFEMLRIIGALIEGTVQPYLKEIYSLALCFHGRPARPDQIRALTLGTVTQAFEELCNAKHLLAPQPWAIPLNQWRNIAQHFSVKVEGSLIECCYGSKSSTLVVFSREDFVVAAQKLFLLFSAIRTSHTIFFLDHADDLISHCKGFKRRDSDKLFHFSVGAASQGFETKHLTNSDGVANAVLEDVSINPDFRARAIHATQFVYQLWIATRAGEVSIEYLSRGGVFRMRGTVSGVECEKVLKGEKKLEYLARVAKFETC